MKYRMVFVSLKVHRQQVIRLIFLWNLQGRRTTVKSANAWWVSKAWEMYDLLPFKSNALSRVPKPSVCCCILYSIKKKNYHRETPLDMIRMDSLPKTVLNFSPRLLVLRYTLFCGIGDFGIRILIQSLRPMKDFKIYTIITKLKFILDHTRE